MGKGGEWREKRSGLKPSSLRGHDVTRIADGDRGAAKLWAPADCDCKVQLAVTVGFRWL